MGDLADSIPGFQGHSSARGSSLFKSKQKTRLQAGVLEKTCWVGGKTSSSTCRVLEPSQVKEEEGRVNLVVAFLSQYMAEGTTLPCRSCCKSD